MDTALPPDDADPQTKGATVKRDDLHSVRNETEGGGPELRRSTGCQLAHMYIIYVTTMYLEIILLEISIILYYNI